MPKIRSDSLFAALKTPENRDTLFEWLLVESISYEEAAARCAERFAFSPSLGSLHGFLSRHAFKFKLEQAKLRAAESAGMLPADFEATKKRGLAQREFELAYSDLTAKELVALKRLELSEAKVRLDERKLVILEKQANEAKATLENSELSPDEKAKRLREIFKRE